MESLACSLNKTYKFSTFAGIVLSKPEVAFGGLKIQYTAQILSLTISASYFNCPVESPDSFFLATPYEIFFPISNKWNVGLIYFVLIQPWYQDILS